MARPIVPERVYRHLLENLANGQWQPGQVLPSLRDIARQLNVSPRPVRQAWKQAIQDNLLDRGPRRRVRVAPGAYERAQEAIASMAARSHGRRLAILTPDDDTDGMHAPLRAHLVRAVTVTAQVHRVQVVGLHRSNQLQQADKIARGYDAALAIDLPPRNLALVTHLVESRFPLLLYQRAIPGLNVPMLFTDSYSAGRRLAELLAQRGHTNVCLISTARCEPVFDKRFLGCKGWLDGVRERGIYDECVMPVVFDRGSDLGMLVEKVMGLRPRPTGLVFDDPAGLDLLTRSPQFKGLSIPEDLSLATLGGTDHLRLPAGLPAITSFEVDWERAGECATEMLGRLMSGMSQKNMRIPMRLRLTESLGSCSARVATRHGRLS